MTATRHVIPARPEAALALRSEWADLTRRLGRVADKLLPLLERFDDLETRTDAAHADWLDSLGHLPDHVVEDAMETFYRASGWEACEAIVAKLSQALPG